VTQRSLAQASVRKAAVTVTTELTGDRPRTLHTCPSLWWAERRTGSDRELAGIESGHSTGRHLHPRQTWRVSTPP